MILNGLTAEDLAVVKQSMEQKVLGNNTKVSKKPAAACAEGSTKGKPAAKLAAKAKAAAKGGRRPRLGTSVPSRGDEPVPCITRSICCDGDWAPRDCQEEGQSCNGRCCSQDRCWHYHRPCGLDL